MASADFKVDNALLAFVSQAISLVYADQHLYFSKRKSDSYTSFSLSFSHFELLFPFKLVGSLASVSADYRHSRHDFFV